jgi:uncharacterized protein (TIGR02246 family)
VTAADRQELRELVERYASAVDRADGSAVASLFSDHGVLALWMDPSSAASTGERRGRDQIASSVDGISRYVATHHTVSSSVATVDGDHAGGETLCTAHHVETTDAGRQDRVLYICYVDAFARTDGTWRFTRREVRVQWVAVHPLPS